MSKTKCWNCSEVGHVSKDCKKPRKVNSKGKSKGKGFYFLAVEPMKANTENDRELHEQLSCLDDRSADFDDCIRWARREFEQLFDGNLDEAGAADRSKGMPGLWEWPQEAVWAFYSRGGGGLFRFP